MIVVLIDNYSGIALTPTVHTAVLVAFDQNVRYVFAAHIRFVRVPPMLPGVVEDRYASAAVVVAIVSELSNTKLVVGGVLGAEVEVVAALIIKLARPVPV